MVRLRSLVRVGLLVGVIAWVGSSNRLSAQDDRGGSSAHGVFGQPILLEGSGCVLVPYGVNGFVEGKLAVGPAFFLNDAISGHVGSPTPLTPPLSFGSCFDAGLVHWNNVMVYHTENHDSVLLLNRKAVIKRFYVPRPEPEHVPKYLVFGIAEANDGGVVDESGPVTLYVSDPQCRELEAVTPPDTQVLGVTFASAGEQMYVQIATDPNGNHRFNAQSPVKVLRVDPLHPVIGAQLWNDELEQQAMHLVAP
jgi:hypothetical protein